MSADGTAESDELRRRDVSSQFARSHDLLDRYGIDRFSFVAEGEPLVEIPLQGRIAMFAERIQQAAGEVVAAATPEDRPIPILMNESENR